MSRHWMGHAERGRALLIQLIARITLRLGRPPGRLLLYPITLYFLIFSGRSRRASRSFLSRALNRPAGLRDSFRHYHTFAATILDRVYFLSGRQDFFKIEIRGEPILREQLRGKRGCLLLGSHLGSFEVLRSLAGADPDLQVRPLMYKANAEKIDSVLRAINPEIADQVISIGEPDSLLQVQEAMAQNQAVGILGDRIAIDDKTVSCRFFDRPCRFPAGPMLLAGLLKVPVVLFFGLYNGGRNYQVHFELLTPRLYANREQRQQQVAEWTQRFVERLEYHCRQAPYNWFNFYDFWDESESQADPPTSRNWPLLAAFRNHLVR